MVNNTVQSWQTTIAAQMSFRNRGAKKTMLSSRERTKAFIGLDVILARCPNIGTPGMIEIVVGHLPDYYYLAQNLPFGTAVMMGATKSSIDISGDEYCQGRTAWIFSVKEKLEEWTVAFPAGIDFLETELPAAGTVEDIHGIVAVASLGPDTLTTYFEKAKELFETDRDMPPPE